MYAYDSTTKDGPGSQRKPTKNPSRTAAPVLAAHSALALQRAAGNAAVTSLLGAGRGGRGHLLPPTVSGSIVRPRQTTDQSLVVARAPVDSRGGTDTTSTRPAGPGPGIRAGGDVSVSAGATVTVEAALRQVYAESARQISEAARDMIRAGTKPEDAARWAVEARNDLKRQIRQRGSVIVKGLAEARNIRKYGNKIGPTYEELIRQGKTPKDIIGKAGKASVRWNRVGSIMKVGGWFLIVVDIAIVTWDVAHAEEGEKVRTATRGVGGIAGALAGGWAGAKLGALAGGGIGALFAGVGAPVGAVVGGIIGGIGGAIAGGIGGRAAAGAAYDAISDEGLVTPALDMQLTQIDAVEDGYIRAHR